MKKRILVLLAVLALMVSCMVFAVSATEGDAVVAPVLAGTEKCPHCSKTLAEITTGGEGIEPWTEVTAATAADADWTKPHLWISEDITLTANPNWGSVDQVILIRSDKDLSVAAEAVVVSMNANAQFTYNTGKAWLSKDLTIYGEKATLQSKMLGSNGGMFRTQSGGNLVLRGEFTIKPMEGAATGTSGGIIFQNKGTVTFDGVTFEDYTSANGGISYSISGGVRAYYENCTFKNIKATSNGGVAWAQCGVVSFKNCDFTDCSATATGGIVFGSDPQVYQDSKTSLYVSALLDVSFENCTVDGVTAATAGMIQNVAGSNTIKNCTITDVAVTGNGGIFNNAKIWGWNKTTGTTGTKDTYAMPTLTITGTTITDCEAGNGGVFYMVGGTANVTNSSISACSVTTDGGAFYTHAVACNTASGGYTYPNVTITGSTISACEAGSDAGFMYISSGGTVVIDSTTVTECDATAQGGALVLKKAAIKLTLKNGTSISGCTAAAGSAMYINNGTVNVEGDTTTISGSANSTTNGGAIYMAAGTLNVKGGTVTGGDALYGGTIYMANGTLAVSGGTINGGNCPATKNPEGAEVNTEGLGGAIYVADGTFKITGGTINGGKAYKGGAIYIAGVDSFTMTAGDIYATNAWTEGEGDAATTKTVNQGGAIFMGAGTFKMSGGTLHGNTRTDAVANAVNGGVAYVYGDAKLQLSDTATIDGGYSTGNGGAIYSYDGGDISLAGTSAIKNAYSRGNGGAIAFGGTATNATFTMTAGEISDCVCYGSTGGGAIYAAAGVDLTISGGKIEGCYDHYFTSSTDSSGKIKYSNSNGGMLYLTGSGTVLNFSGGTLYGTGNESDRTKVGDFSNNEISLRSGAVMNMSGNAKVEIGNDVAVIQLVQGGATLTLRDNASVANAGGFARDINIAGNYECNLLIDNNWTGTAKLSNFKVNLGVAYADANRHIACGTWNEAGEWVDGGYMHSGKLVMDQTGTEEYKNPTIVAGVTGDGTMTHCAALVVNTNDGTVAGYTTGQAAVDDASVAGTYAKLYDNREELALAEGATAYVDVNGFDFTIANQGTLYAFDSSATTTKNGTGSVAAGEGVVAPMPVFAYDGGYAVSWYYPKDNCYIFYRVEMEIKNVSLRPGEAGVYFTAQFKGDDDAMKLLDSMGVAVTTTEDELNYNSLEQFLYTTATKNSGAHNGVLISNILGTDSAAMADRVTTKIQAAAYFTVDGVTYMVPAAKKISLQDVVNAVATLYGAEGKTEDLNEQQKANMYELYKACKAITVEEGADPLVWTAIADFDAMIEDENNDTEGGEGTGDSTGDGTGENA